MKRPDGLPIYGTRKEDEENYNEDGIQGKDTAATRVFHCRFARSETYLVAVAACDAP